MIRKAEGKGMYGRGAAGDPEAVIWPRSWCGCGNASEAR